MSFRSHNINEKKRKKLSAFPWRKVLAAGVMIGRPLYDLGKKMYERKKRQEHLQKAFTVGASLIVALVIILLTFSLLIKVSGISVGSLMKVTGAPIGATEDGVTNILLLGEGDETGQNLIDTIIIASIDPVKTKSVSMLSVPRDLYFLHTDEAMETEKGKVNSLWRDNAIIHMKAGMETEEAGDLSLVQFGKEISNAFNVPIHHVVKVDFAAFEQIVDAMGGLDIMVPEAIHDEKYPGPNYTYTTFDIAAGMHHMDGATALQYARTRSTTSDFDRSHRQQMILHAAAEKAKESGMLKNPSKIMELYGILAEHIQTDLKTRQLVTLAGIAKDLNKDRFVSLQLNNVNGLYGEPQWKGGILYSPPRNLFDGEFVLLPVSIPEFPVTWKQVQVLTKLFFGMRELYIGKPAFAILNGGSPAGSAGKLGREFTKFGFDVVKTRNVPGSRDIDASFIAVNKDDVEGVGTFFSNLFSMPVQELPAEFKAQRCGEDTQCAAEEFGDITVVLGKDYQFSYFQDLIQ